MEQVDYFHFDMEIGLESGEGANRLELPFKFVGDFQSPDRTQATLEISILSNNITSDVIIIGDTSYATNPVTGEWQFSPDALLPIEGPYKIVSIDPSDIGDLTLVGDETLNGVSVHHLRGSVDPFSIFQGQPTPAEREQLDAEMQIDYWIGVDDSRLMRILAEGAVRPTEQAAAQSGSTDTSELSLVVDISLSNFGIPVAISAPEVAAAPIIAQPAIPPDVKQYDALPALTIDPNRSYTAIFEMENGGEIVIALAAKEATVTVNNFVFLARDGFYDGVTFHRVLPGFMAQGGDPLGTGRGGPGYQFDNEFHPNLRHDGPGVISMANSGVRNGQGTNGSQFFITYTATLNLDGLNPDGSPKNCEAPVTSCHAVFGRVIEGMDVLNNLTPRDPGSARTRGDVITTIRIVEE